MNQLRGNQESVQIKHILNEKLIHENGNDSNEQCTTQICKLG